MGMKLTGRTMDPTPVVSIKAVVGSYFKGTLLDLGNERKLKKGKSMVYTFALDSTDMNISVKNPETDEYNDVTEISQGDKVSVFAPTVLSKALAQAKIGQVITIKYLGIPEGKEYHNFDVEAD